MRKLIYLYTLIPFGCFDTKVVQIELCVNIKKKCFFLEHENKIVFPLESINWTYCSECNIAKNFPTYLCESII